MNLDIEKIRAINAPMLPESGEEQTEFARPSLPRSILQTRGTIKQSEREKAILTPRWVPMDVRYILTENPAAVQKTTTPFYSIPLSRTPTPI